MKKNTVYYYLKLLFLFCFILLVSCSAPNQQMQPVANMPYLNLPEKVKIGNFVLSESELREIARRIYINECGGKKENLAFWNSKEPFPSMGIGHFIWFPKGFTRPYGDTFPKLLMYYEANGVKIPSWIKRNNYACPWNTRNEFYRDYNKKQIRELIDLLYNTMELQTQFIIIRFEEAVNKIFNEPMSPQMRQHVKVQFYRVANTPMGLYPLIDYVNFKGTGVANTGDWGLLQVLQNMKGNGTGKQALIDFADSAKYVLNRRVANSKNKHQEAKFLPGWFKRIDTYVM